MRKIIHIDMDCFFAAVEMRDNPAWRHIPLAIGGSRTERGVISTCNYPARAYGVRSAMPSGQAFKLCPQLVLVPGNMDKYRAVSTSIQAIFHRYTDIVEPLSLDEAYLDVSTCELFQGSATRIAEHIRQTIFLETGLTASAGVAPNKFLAKIASDENKPDGLFVIPPDQVSAFVETLSLRKIPGVGQKTAEKLAKLGLHRCSDVLKADLQILVREFGSFAEILLERSQGLDSREVHNERERKSVAVEQTFSQDLTTPEQSMQPLAEMYQKLVRRIERCEAQEQIQKIGIKLKFQDFRQTTIERQHPELCFNLLQQLLNQAWLRGQGKAVRLVGIHVGLKSNAAQAQLDLDWMH
ncbi:MAG: DNA polymerase IV [Rheinheimera sp.]|nr:DNA polymerase IV [Rheinheimera sp.]